MSEDAKSEDAQREKGGIGPAKIQLPPDVIETIQRVAESPDVAVEARKLEKAVLAVIQTRQLSYFRQGPLPHPRELAEYESVLPGAAERIIAASERQAAHRMGLEKDTK